MLTVKSGLDFFLIRWLWFSWEVWMESKCWFAWMESRWGAQMGSECWFQWFSEEKEDLT